MIPRMIAQTNIYIDISSLLRSHIFTADTTEKKKK